jgi:hypothetical protein
MAHVLVHSFQASACARHPYSTSSYPSSPSPPAATLHKLKAVIIDDRPRWRPRRLVHLHRTVAPCAGACLRRAVAAFVVLAALGPRGHGHCGAIMVHLRATMQPSNALCRGMHECAVELRKDCRCRLTVARACRKM